MADDECLQIEQPEGCEKHEADDHEQQFPGKLVAKGRENREAENSEIGNCANERQGYATNCRVRTAQHFRAAGKSATYALSGDMLDRKVNGIGQSGQGD